jgi:cell division protein FtsL
MLKNLIIRLILTVIIISSVLAISRQVSIILSARQSIRDLETKISNLEKRSQLLDSATKD